MAAYAAKSKPQALPISNIEKGQKKRKQKIAAATRRSGRVHYARTAVSGLNKIHLVFSFFFFIFALISRKNFTISNNFRQIIKLVNIENNETERV